jgi:hypothetical protein
MLEIFDCDVKSDPAISEISFTDANNQNSIQIVAKNKKEASLLKGKIIGLRGIYDTGNPTKQNFSIDIDENTGTIKISGNIFNAFKLLNESNLISPKLAKEILENNKVSAFLDKTKDFVLPENREAPPENTKAITLQNVSIAQESYVNALLKLDATQLEMALNSFTQSLASKGMDVQIIVPKQANTSQTPS